MQRLEELQRLLVERLLVEDAKPLARLAADEDVLRDRQVGHQVEFLVDDADAKLLRRSRAGNLDLFAFEQDPPASLV